MATAEETIKNINKQVGDINIAAGELGFQSDIKPLAPITPEQVSGEEVAFVSREVPEDGAVDAGLASLEQVGETAPAPQPVEQKEVDPLGMMVDQYTSALAGQMTEEEIRDVVEQETAIDPLDRELAQINADLLREQNSLRREIESLQDTPGVTKGVTNAAIQAAKRKSYRTQADMAIVQMGLQGQYDAAKRAADRAVDAIYSKQKQEAETRRFLFELNYDRFTELERREFETAEADRQRALDSAEHADRTLSDTKLSAIRMAQTNGAPMEVIRAIAAAQTPEKAITAGGQWGSVDMLDRQYKRAQINHIAFQEHLAASKMAQELIDKAEGKKLQAEEKEALDRAKREKATGDVGAAIVAQGVVQKMIGEIEGPFKQTAAVGPEGLFGINFVRKFVGKQLTPTETDDFLSNLDQLKGIITMEGREGLKGTGTITDTETTIAANAESWLNSEHALGTKESRWEEELTRLNGVFKNAEIRALYYAYTPAERAELGFEMDSTANKNVYQNGELLTTTFEDVSFNPENLYD